MGLKQVDNLVQNTANFVGILFAVSKVTEEADYNRFGEKKKENRDLREVKKKGLLGGRKLQNLNLKLITLLMQRPKLIENNLERCRGQVRD